MGNGYEDGCGYESDYLDLGFEICVDGAVGNGKKAKLEVYTSDSAVTDPGLFADKSGWDGSAVNFPNWHRDGARLSGCEISSSNLRVEQSKKNDNEVLLTISISLFDCQSWGQVYARCGGEGSHVLESSRTVTMTKSPGCTEGVGILL